MENTKSFSMLDAGCFGYIKVSGECDEGDDVCKALKKIGAGFTQYFRYGSWFSVSQINSEIDEYKRTRPDYWIEIFDKNSDGKIDLIGINNGAKHDRWQYISYSDSGKGSFDTVMLKDCKTTAILASNFEKYNDDKHDPNYCFAEQSGTSAALKLGGAVIGIGGALFASGGSALLLMATAGATGATLEVIADVRNAWP